ncbi:hypothetical protein niasHS_014998 [Heterodera schachtii]|uniref:Uncharacterized protein n=1 Tax=Heterodera schachtii TaxID=97005 RepID=A0ABD2IDD9_HETSC
MDNEQQKKTHRERSKSHNDWSAQFAPPFASPTQPKSRPSSSSNSPPSAAEEDENPLPAAFRIGNESESSDESGAERSEHEEEVIRRSKQIRNRERWELLKYKMLISSCCTPSKNPSKNDNELPANCKNETTEEEEEQWDEEREREFVFSLL